MRMIVRSSFLEYVSKTIENNTLPEPRRLAYGPKDVLELGVRPRTKIGPRTIKFEYKDSHLCPRPSSYHLKHKRVPEPVFAHKPFDALRPFIFERRRSRDHLKFMKIRTHWNNGATNWMSTTVPVAS